MERREPRAPPAAAWKPRRLARWKLRELFRVASKASAAGARAVQMHGAVIYLWHPEGPQPGRRQQRASVAVGDAPTASSAEPKPLSKRKQRSSLRLAEFQRQKELRSAQLAAARLKRLWSVVWLQRLVRRWMGSGGLLLYLSIREALSKHSVNAPAGAALARRRRRVRGLWV